MSKNKLEGGSPTNGDKEEKKPKQGESLQTGVESFLGPENKTFFEKMSDEGAKIANQVYEGLYKIPVVNKIVGKMEIAYSQFWIDRHQEKAIQYKEKMDELDLQIGKFDQAIEKLKSSIDDLRQQGMPMASLELKLQVIHKQKEELSNKKDKAQTQFEKRDNKLRMYTNERDRAADKFIGRYEEKLIPLEEELKRLKTEKDVIDLQEAIDEIKYKKELAELERIEKSRKNIEDALLQTGNSYKRINRDKDIKDLNEKLRKGREKIQADKEILIRRRAEINQRIAKVDAKANPYRDKREKFVRIKERRPIEIDAAVRQKREVFTKQEKAAIHERAEPSYTKEPTTSEAETKNQTEPKIVDEKTKDINLFKISDLTTEWKTFVEKKHKKEVANQLILDMKDFSKIIYSLGLSKNDELDFEDFKNILDKYIKVKKLPMKQFNESIDSFFKEKVKK